MITFNGITQSGMVVIDGVVQPAGGGGGPISSADVTDVTYGDVQTGLALIDTTLGTLNTDITALEPTHQVNQSFVFVNNVFQTVFSYTVPAGSAGSFAVQNSIVYTGTAANVTASQIRYSNSFRRISAGAAVVQAGAPGVQGSILTTTVQMVASGNDILLQLRFGVSATIFCRIPIYIDTIQL